MNNPAYFIRVIHNHKYEIRVVKTMGFVGSCGGGGVQAAAFVLVLFILLVIILRAGFF